MKSTTLSNLRTSPFLTALRSKLLLAPRPHHSLDCWRLCQIIYEGLDQYTRTMVEFVIREHFEKE